ncbi:MAG: hypothetical protein HYY17_07580 [Planctomycetes bacterium]|nr:hypothetical protein [Planctomycetota bacterium]
MQTDCSGVLLLAIAVAGVFLLVWGTRWRPKGDVLTGDLASVAESLGGEVATDPSRALPFIRFTRAGAKGFFLRWRSGSTAVTSVEISVPAGGTAELISRGSRFAGDASYDWADGERPCGVKGDAAWLAKLEEGGWFRFAEDLLAWAGAAIRLRTDRERLTLEVDSVVKKDRVQGLMGFMDAFVRIVQTGMDPGRVDVVEADLAAPGGVCQVCTSPLAETVVRCAKCGTPHHADCWKYLGKCSTYGCGETETAV